MNTLRLSPHLYAEKLHTPSAVRQAEDVARRGRRQWCEIRVPGKASGGFGESDQSEKILGPYLASFAEATEPSSMDGDLRGVKDTVVWEIAFARPIMVPGNARIATPHFVPTWAKETSYAVGDRVVPKVTPLGTMPFFECVTAGSSGSAQPDWPLQMGTTIGDGDVIWRLLGRVTFLEVIGSNATETHSSCTILLAKEIG